MNVAVEPERRELLMSAKKRDNPKDRHVRIRSVRATTPDLRKLAGVVIALAQARAEAEAQAEAKPRVAGADETEPSETTDGDAA
jgi:hypothetical protein